MTYRHGEYIRLGFEPRPLGVEIDQPSLDAFGEFYNSLYDPYHLVYEAWADEDVTNPTVRQHMVAILTAPREAQFTYSTPYDGISALRYAKEPSGPRDGEQPLRSRLANSQARAHEIAAGVLYWLDDNRGKDLVGAETFAKSAHDYQRTIAQLLPLVSPEVADRLYAHYPILDAQNKWNIATEEGYHQMVMLVADEGVPMDYRKDMLGKWMLSADVTSDADEKVRAEAKKLMHGLASLAANWKITDEQDGFELFKGIISFLESRHGAGEPYASPADIRKIADKIGYNPELRLQFSLRHLCYQGSNEGQGFRISNSLDEAFVKGIRFEAHFNGILEPLDVLDSMITEYEQRTQQVDDSREAFLRLRLGLRDL